MKLQHTIKFGIFFICLFAASYANATTDCSERLSKIVCEVAPPKNMQDRFTINRPCLNKRVDKYQRILKDAFAKFPPLLQERFCSLERIYIEDEFFGAAWSAPVDENNPVRFMIGLRKAELDSNLSFSKGHSEFDSQTFGVSTKAVSYEIFSTNQLTSTEFTIIHELGHTFDYEHSYNRPATDPEFPKSWTAITWHDIQTIQPAMDFPLRSAICLNHCGGKFIPMNKASSLYSAIYAHGFLSQLSAINAMEDFADSFAFFVADEILNIQIQVEVNGSKYDLHQMETGQPFSKKRDFLKKIFRAKDINLV